MKARTQQGRLLETAYHEAGHAVAHITLGLGFLRASIAGDESSEGRVLGCITQAEFTLWKTEDPDLLEWPFRRQIVAFYAGPIAQAEYSRRSLNAILRPTGDGGSDRAKAVLLSSRLRMSEREERAYHAWLIERARSLLSTKFARAGLPAIARALIQEGTLPHEEVRRIHFEAIEAVVQDALRHRKSRRGGTPR